MAVEWIVSDGRPIDPRALRLDVEVAFAWAIHATVTLQFGQDSGGRSDSLESDEFSLLLESRSESASSQVELDQFDFDPSSGTCFGYVTAYRTKLSVALGIVVASCWHFIAGGDLSGTGLSGKRFSVDESKKLLDDLFQGATKEERIGRAVEKLGCGSFPYE